MTVVGPPAGFLEVAIMLIRSPDRFLAWSFWRRLCVSVAVGLGMPAGTASAQDKPCLVEVGAYIMANLETLPPARERLVACLSDPQPDIGRDALSRQPGALLTTRIVPRDGLVQYSYVPDYIRELLLLYGFDLRLVGSAAQVVPLGTQDPSWEWQLPGENPAAPWWP